MSNILETPVQSTRQVGLAEALQIAVAQHRQGELTAAEDIYQQVLRISPDNVEALHLLGVVRCQQGRLEEAEPLLLRAIQLGPDVSAFHNSWGRLQLLKGNQNEAVAALQRALELSPQNPEAFFNLAEAELASKALDAAIPHYEQVLMLKPVYPEARFGLAQAIRQRDGWAAAIAHYQLAVAQTPDNPLYLHHLALSLQLSNHLEDAQVVFTQITDRWPAYVDAWIGRAGIYFVWGRLSEAISAYEQALQLDPQRSEALDGLVEVRRRACDWRDDMESREQALIDMVQGAIDQDKPPKIRIFTALYTPFTAYQQLQIAKANAEGSKPIQQQPRWDDRVYQNQRMRIGYLIADVRDHPNAHNTLLMYGLHDRTRFEVFTYSWGLDDQSPYRKRIMSESEHFTEMRGWSDEAMARRIAADGIQILVDLMGHTGDNRMGILARRAAPIQVNYLGFPCTSGADFMDYILGDPWVTPMQEAANFSECIVQLPWSYQINSHQVHDLGDCPAREALGLPENAFVYCCFNNSYKIDARIFGLWMEILQAVPDSVLWLFRTSDLVDQALRKAAQQRGLDPRRLVFSPYVKRDEHLNRLQAADLFLDTEFYNAHTTASDALWAGVPILTVPGKTFAARVAASLLRAAHLPDGILPDWESYVQRAIALAQSDRTVLESWKWHLKTNRSKLPVFDTATLVGYIENAYEQMWMKHQAGEQPVSFKLTTDDQEVSHA